MSGGGSNYPDWFEDIPEESYRPDLSQLGIEDYTAGATTRGPEMGDTGRATAMGPETTIPTFESGSAPQSKKKKKYQAVAGDEDKARVNYSEAEVNRLVSIWMETTHDPIRGADRDGVAYWRDIAGKYNRTRDPSWLERDHIALKSLWGRVVKAVKKWLPAYDTTVRNWGSGKNDAHIKEEAQKLYNDNKKGTPFKYFDAAEMLRQNPRFATLRLGGEPPAKKSMTSESGDDGGEGSVGTRPGRPMGQKAAKAAARDKGKGPATSSAAMSGDVEFVGSYLSSATDNLATLIETKTRLVDSQDRIAQAAVMKAEAARRRIEAAEKKVDMKILAADPSKMSAIARATHEALVKEIMARRFPNEF